METKFTGEKARKYVVTAMSDTERNRNDPLANICDCGAAYHNERLVNVDILKLMEK